jgi:1,4-alpha-glucan branching enzyme
VFSFLRYDGEGQMVASVVNFSAVPRPDYRIGLPREGVWTEILNTDADAYDGSGQFGNLGQVVAKAIPSHGYSASATVTIPPLGAVWLRLESTPDEEQSEPQKVSAGVKAAAKSATPGRKATKKAAEQPAQAKPAGTGTEPQAKGPRA